jgi:hypothetical protein
MFFGTLKGLKTLKSGLSVRGQKKVSSILMWIALPKSHKGVVTHTHPATSAVVTTGGVSLYGLVPQG